MFSLKKKRKTPVQKKTKQKTMKHEKLYTFTLFPCFCFRLLWLWIVFLESVSVLRFFFFLSMFSVGDTYFSFGILCFCFLVVFFCFGFPILSYVFLFWVCSFLFLLLLLSCGFFVSIGHPIYLIVLCI